MTQKQILPSGSTVRQGRRRPGHFAKEIQMKASVGTENEESSVADRSGSAYWTRQHFSSACTRDRRGGLGSGQVLCTREQRTRGECMQGVAQLPRTWAVWRGQRATHLTGDVGSNKQGPENHAREDGVIQ